MTVIMVMLSCVTTFLAEDGNLRSTEQDKMTFEQAAKQELLFTKMAVEVLTTVKDKKTATDAVKKLQSIGKDAREFWAKGYFENLTDEQIEDFHLKNRVEIASIHKMFRTESLRLKQIDGGEIVIQEFIAQLRREAVHPSGDKKHHQTPSCRTGR